MIFKPAYTLFLKTSTYCNAGCCTCPAGRKLPEDKETSGMMRPEMMERILSYVLSQGRVISSTLHFYGEPTMIPWIADLVRINHEHGVHCLMSTNGSFGDRLMQVMDQGLTNLIFSVSGWTQEIHEISHKGVKIATVKDNMHKVAQHIATHRDFRGNRQFVRVSWHDYEYNRHERDLMQEFSDRLGFHFTSYNTGLLPLERAQRRMLQARLVADSPEDVGERDLRTKLKDADKLCFERRHQSCDNQFRKLTIDSDGYLHNCCVKAHDANRRGFLFDTNLEEFNRFRMEEDTDCKTCKVNGWHKYAEQSYRTPLTLSNTVKRKLGDFWKANNFGGVFPGVSAKYSQRTYTRPQKEQS